MARKDIVRATNFRLSKIAGQKCVIAELKIRCTVPYDYGNLQESLDAKTDEKWPLSLAEWNDPIRDVIEKMVAKIKKLNKREKGT